MLKKLLLIVFLFPTFVFAQEKPNPFKIKEAKGLFRDRCKEYKKTLKELPVDVRYGIIVEGRFIYFTIPSLEHFHKLFDDNQDGIAIDIIHKNQFQCEVESELRDSWPNRGYLLAPMYKDEMEQNMFLDELNNVVVEYGFLPDQFHPSEIECNVLTIQNKALCNYNVIANVEFGSWDLLEMGFYWDSIPETGKIPNIQTFSKTIEFTIPFEKNKSKFLATDIKPLYDSLELTDFDITEISILAYTSVEGSVEQNKMLQKGRAQSIVDALQAYQTKEIKKNIVTKENWTKFAKDISGTEFHYLKKYSKDEIRRLLSKDEELLNSLEPILAKQRMGRIRLVLQKKVSLYEEEPDKLKSIFQSSLTDANLDQAIFLQHIIFDRIREESLPDDFINQLEVPKESAYGPLFNNIILFNWERNSYDLHQAIQELENFQALFPNSFKLKYNLIVLTIRAWSEGKTAHINRETIGKLIEDLKKTEIHPSLVERLKINYYLLLAQHQTYEKEFEEKSRSVRNIYHHYKKLELDDQEVLRLAKFLAFYSEFKVAVDVLNPKVKSKTVSEDLLFYYLKLTIGNQMNGGSSAYKKLLQKAVSLNNERYCELFLPKAQGGFTFQLKESKMLKDSYCENCIGKLNR